MTPLEEVRDALARLDKAASWGASHGEEATAPYDRLVAFIRDYERQQVELTRLQVENAALREAFPHAEQ